MNEANDLNLVLFKEAWESMSSSEEISFLLSSHRLEELEAMRLLRGRFTYQFQRENIEALFKKLCFVSFPISLNFHTQGIREGDFVVSSFSKLESHLTIENQNTKITIDEFSLYECYVVHLPAGEEAFIFIYDETGRRIMELKRSELQNSIESAYWSRLIFDLKYENHPCH